MTEALTRKLSPLELRELRAKARGAQEFEAMKRRLLDGEPLQYILGEWDFIDITLEITNDVLIPRDDTAVLAFAALEKAKGMREPRILDICCGSGCIGLFVASRCPGAGIVFCDNSQKALDVARRNAEKMEKVSESCRFIKADALSPPGEEFGSFDIILCNPPYISEGEWGSLDRSVRDYEPRQALVGGDDGMMFYRVMPGVWKSRLLPGGELMFEIGASQAGAVCDIMASEGFVNIRKMKDLSGIERVVRGSVLNVI